MIEPAAVLRKLLPNNRFARGASVLAGGTAGAQLLLLIASPLLTRLYSPETFGLLAVYTSILTIFVVVAGLRYELAIPLPEDEQEAASLTILSLVSVIALSLVSALLVIFSGESVANFIRAPLLVNYSWLLPVGIFFTGGYQVFNFYSIRLKTFSAISSARIKQTAVTLAIQLLGYKLTSGALLIGHASGQGVGCISLGRIAINRPYFGKINLPDLLAVAIKYRRFPLYSTWGGLLNAAGGQLPPLLFAGLFSPAAAGIYALAYRVVGMPITLIGNAIGNVFISRAADAHRQNRLAGLVVGVYDKLVHIAVPPALVFLVVAPDLFTVVFGEQWRAAGRFAQWMVPWLLLVFVTSPLSAVYEVMGKQKLSMFFQIALLLIRLTALAIGGAVYANVEVAIALFSVGSAFCWLFFLSFILKTTGCDLLKAIAPLAKAIFWGGVCVAPLFLAAMRVVNYRELAISLILSLTLISVRLFLLLRGYWR